MVVNTLCYRPLVRLRYAPRLVICQSNFVTLTMWRFPVICLNWGRIVTPQKVRTAFSVGNFPLLNCCVTSDIKPFACAVFLLRRKPPETSLPPFATLKNQIPTWKHNKIYAKRAIFPVLKFLYGNMCDMSECERERERQREREREYHSELLLCSVSLPFTSLLHWTVYFWLYSYTLLLISRHIFSVRNIFNFGKYNDKTALFKTLRI